MGAFYHTKVAGATATATTEAAGYLASNALLESIGRPWRATGTGATDYVMTWASGKTIAAILVQDVNFASCAVLTSTDAVAYSAAGTLTTHADKLIGRRRGLIVLNGSGLRGVKLTISAGTPTDGLSYWRIGAANPFAIAVTFPRGPGGDMRVRALYAQLRNDLPNRLVSVATTGNDVLSVSLPFKRDASRDALELVRRARAGTVGLALGLAEYPELVLPVRHVEEAQEESFAGGRITQFAAELREVT
jgi:hypothetical protein